MKIFLLQALVAASLCGAAPAEQTTTPSTATLDDLQKPVLSTTGRKRLEENIKTLATNAKDLQENISASEKNMETIRNELREISVLEKEHLDLKAKYDAYMVHAEEELKKNDRAKRDLAKWEERHAAAPKEAADGALKDKIEAARLEQADRDRWKADALTKMKKVKELTSGIERNLADVRSRRKPLEQQLNQWTGRRSEYQKLLTETESKKAQWERVLVR